MIANPPLEVARVLAAEYGHVLAPVNYVRGVAISGRLRLHQFAPAGDSPAPSIVEAVEPHLSPEATEALRDADGSVHTGYLWAGELTAGTGDQRYADLLLRIADLYMESGTDGWPAPVDPDRRVEDIFFAGSLLGRAFEISSDARYAEALTPFLERVEPDPQTGLWLHCNASPFRWGRGNAFAALGFAEALTYLPSDDPRRAALEAKHRAHLEALIRHQDASGAWRQVIDRPDSYLELTATAMIGTAIVRGIRRGWLSSDLDPVAEHTWTGVAEHTWTGVVARAWAAVAERIDEAGMVRDSCPGTGPLPALDDYLHRQPIEGHDDRAGSMALWFAVEYAEYLAGPADGASETA